MPEIKITNEVLDTFFEYLEQGMTKGAAAKKLGFNLNGIRIAAERNNRTWPTRSPIRDKIIEKRDEIESTIRSQKEWAEMLNVSQPRINVLFKEMNIETKDKRRVRRSNDDEKYDLYRKLLGHIVTHGGYTAVNIRELGLQINAQDFRNFVRDLGIDITHFQFAWQEYGRWLTVPGPWERRPPCNYYVPAVCRDCGSIHRISIQNAKIGKTNACASCAHESKEWNRVLHVETGRIYRSVSSWTKDIGQFNSYQKLRIQLRNAGEVELEGQHYRLISSQDSSGTAHPLHCS